MAGALDAQLMALLSGNLQPLQSGAVTVPIAIPFPMTEASGRVAKPSPKPKLPLSSPGITNPSSPPSGPPPPLPLPLPLLGPNPGSFVELPHAYKPTSAGKTNPIAATPTRMARPPLCRGVVETRTRPMETSATTQRELRQRFGSIQPRRIAEYEGTRNGPYTGPTRCRGLALLVMSPTGVFRPVRQVQAELTLSWKRTALSSTAQVS